MGPMDSLAANLDHHRLTRGDADKVAVYLRSVTLQSGDLIEFDRQGVTVIAGANNCGKSLLLGELHRQLTAGVWPGKLAGLIDRAMDGEYEDYVDWLCRHTHYVDKDRSMMNPSFKRLETTMEVATLAQMRHGVAETGPGFLLGFFVKYLPAGPEAGGFAASARDDIFQPPSDPLHVLTDSAELFEELNALVYKILGVRLTLDDLNRTSKLRVGTPQASYPVGRYEDKVPYQTEVESLPLLAEQGDGMRSLLKILVPLVTATYPILIIDEPETFLHPPQAFALGQELGRMASKKGIQIVLATHDRDILAGLVNTSVPSVVRLVRPADNRTRAHQLRATDLSEIWRDPVLKYSRVLDGLFHKIVVLAEAERDCRFFEAALDYYQPGPEEEGGPGVLPPSEVLFIPTSGTSNMPRLATALEHLKVPVIACPDLDVLDNESVIKNIVEALGGKWKDLAEDWKSVAAPLSEPAKLQLVASVLDTITTELEAVVASDSRAKYTGEIKKKITEALKPPSRPWDAVKHHGIEELLRVNGRNGEAVRRLMQGLEERNVIPVAVGELESFGHGLNGEKGKTWLPAALQAGIQKQAAAQQHVKKIISAAERLNSA